MYSAYKLNLPPFLLVMIEYTLNRMYDDKVASLWSNDFSYLNTRHTLAVYYHTGLTVEPFLHRKETSVKEC